MMLSPVTLSLLHCMILLLLSRTVVTQTYTHLPSAPNYADGGFTSPNTSTTQIYTIGSEMNVSWHTEYSKINLYLIYGKNYASPTTCLSGSTSTWWLWTVDDLGNNTDPFSFRIVDEEGTVAEQTSGGFYTGQFWLKPAAGESSSSTLASTSKSSSSTRVTVSSSSHTWTTIAAASSAVSTSAVASVLEPAETSSSTMSSSSSSSGTSSSVRTGVGVGVGLGVAALIAGALVLWRWNRKRSNQRPHKLSSHPDHETVTRNGDKRLELTSTRPVPPELPYELDHCGKRQSPYEAPDFWQEPRELPSTPVQR